MRHSGQPQGNQSALHSINQATQGDSSMTYSTEIIRRVYEDEVGAFIQVGPDGDCPDFVCVSTPDEKSKEWFGSIRLTGNKQLMSELAKAILEACK